ncbi:MAG: protein-glutamate O-methyltransferase CheR [Rhizomicrobium sp.]
MIAQDDFDFLAQLLKRRSGLVLGTEKGYLVESRLKSVIDAFSTRDIAGIVARLRTGDERLAVAVTEVMTTNESFFFRDGTPFTLFKDTMLPAMMAARAETRSLSVWCTAASTGQEPYSLAMLLKESALLLKDWRVQILGTDISKDVLARAEAGLYSQFEVQRGLPVQFLIKYFTKIDSQWRIKDEIRAMVQYRRLNLLDSYLGMGPFDVVYCRNVLIYFEEATKRQVLERIAALMHDDSFLVLGAAESVFGVTDAFAPVEGARGLYRRRPRAGAAKDIDSRRLDGPRYGRVAAK